MYKSIAWAFTKNLEHNLVDGSLMKKGIEEGWNARAYTNPFQIVDKAGLKILHNDNPAEATEYAMGFAEAPVIALTQPTDIKYGFYFVQREVIIIHNNVIVTTYDSTNDNGEYIVQFDGTNVNYYVKFKNKPQELIISTSFTNTSVSYGLVAVVKKSYQTYIEGVFNQDGIYNIKFNGVQYQYSIVDATSGEATDVLGNAIEQSFSIPANTPLFRFLSSDYEIFQESVVSDSIRWVENESGKEVLFNVTKKSGNYIEIQPVVTADESNTYAKLRPNSLYTIFVSRSGAEILTETTWTKFYRNVPLYSSDTNEQFVERTYDVVLQRPSDSTGLVFWTNMLDSEAITRQELVMEFVNGPEYQSASFKEIQLTFDPFQFIFKTDVQVDNVDETVFTDFVNDIYFKSQNLNALIDPDRIIQETAELFNFKYNVTEYDAEEHEYNELDTELKFDNSNVIEELFVKQYMPEYVQYFNDLNALAVFEFGNVKDLKSIILKNITLLNYFKGNKEQMEFLIMLFANSIGYFLVSVDPDPYENFVYRISTTMPRRFWDNDMKHITHPLGWNDFFIKIPTDATCPTQITMWTDPEWAENFLVLNHRMPKTYLDYARFTGCECEWIKAGNYTYNANSEDFESHYQFPFKPAEYDPSLDFKNNLWLGDNDWQGRDGLYYRERSTYPTLVGTEDGTSIINWMEGERNAPHLIRHVADYRKDLPMHHLMLLKSGLGTRYIWDVYKNGQYVRRQYTWTPEARFEQDDPNAAYDIVLTLMNCAGWQKSFYHFYLPSLAGMTQTKIRSYQPEHWSDRKWLDMTFENAPNVFEGSSIENFLTHYRANFFASEYSVSDTTEAIYWALQEGNFVLTNFATDGSYKNYKMRFEIYELPYGAGRYQENLSPSGFDYSSDLYTKFVWEIREGTSGSGDVINIIETNIPNVSIQLHTSEVGNRNVTLKAYRCDDEYIYTNNFVLS